MPYSTKLTSWRSANCYVFNHDLAALSVYLSITSENEFTFDVLELSSILELYLDWMTGNQVKIVITGPNVLGFSAYEEVLHQGLFSLNYQHVVVRVVLDLDFNRIESQIFKLGVEMSTHHFLVFASNYFRIYHCVFFFSIFVILSLNFVNRYDGVSFQS